MAVTARFETTVVHQDIECSGEPASHPGESARHQRTNWMGGSGDAGDHVLRTGGSMDVREEENPSLRLETPAELLGDAGLAHTSLSGQQYVIAVPHSRLQHLKLGFAIEEVLTAYPATGGRSHGLCTVFNRSVEPVDVNNLVVNRIVDNYSVE